MGYTVEYDGHSLGYAVELTGVHAQVWIENNYSVTQLKPGQTMPLRPSHTPEITALSDFCGPDEIIKENTAMATVVSGASAAPSGRNLRQALRWVYNGADAGHIHSLTAQQIRDLESGDLVSYERFEGTSDGYVWDPKLTTLGEYELRRLDILTGDDV